MNAMPSTAPPKWRKQFPDLKIPDGLTFEDLCEVAELIRAWEKDDDEYTAIPLAAKIHAHFQAAAARNIESGLSESNS